MGKYTKMALVLLYLLQLVIVFREQLVHLYRTAVDSVHHQTERAANPHPGLRAVLERVVKIGRPAPGREAILATAAPVVAMLSSPRDEDGPEHPHDDDDKKDRAKRQKRTFLRQFIIMNLWPSVRSIAAPPSSTGARAGAIARALASALIPAPAPKA
ncbi:MAG TPA: hypothetical protein VL426_02210 [Candidatus Binatia bacterium]|jgi:hypothetical protein|nr:hypothetical protein [Candidatus Binatia bacterium]